MSNLYETKNHETQKLSTAQGKTEGQKKRLRAIDRWADSFEGYFPSAHSGEQYWHWKMPTLDRLVNRPTTSKKLQAHCASALLRAASFIEKAKPGNLDTAIVTVLLTHPDMFDSEICVFFDSKYYSGFFDRNLDDHKLTKIPARSLLHELGVAIPVGFEEVGFHFVMKDEWEGEVSTHEEDWWSYRPIQTR